mgnify:CR=1 FL=1
MPVPAAGSGLSSGRGRGRGGIQAAAKGRGGRPPRRNIGPAAAEQRVAQLRNNNPIDA